jgi:LysR family transcriptional regulator, glycine cleavage system transcriptional activator
MASTELNVTPAAVSHRIKALENELGQPLFNRQYRGVELTEAGALLFVSLQRGFETISGTVQRIRSRHDRSGVSIAATTAMSGLWLTPRLAAFWKEHPGVAISQLIQDDRKPQDVDLSIHYGDPEAEDDETRVLFSDRILALGTEQFAETWGITRLADLSDVPLIHTQSGVNPYTEWSEWFATLDRPAPRGPGFHLNNYLISLQAAEDHIGAVLGWEGLLAAISTAVGCCNWCPIRCPHRTRSTCASMPAPRPMPGSSRTGWQSIEAPPPNGQLHAPKKQNRRAEARRSVGPPGPRQLRGLRFSGS